MKKITLVLLCLICHFGLRGQSYLGYLGDNYSGINSVILNPANIADSRFKADINLIGVSALLGNDYYKGGLSDINSNADDFDDESRRSPKDSNNFFGNVDVLGPSFMFNIVPKHSIGITTRVRTSININDINGNLYDNIADDFDENEDYSVNEGNVYSTSTTWGEIGLTYAAVLMDRKEHFLKGGVSLKYLKGFTNAYSNGRNITFSYDADGGEVTPGVSTGSITSTGEISYGAPINDDVDNVFSIDANGFATDLGFVYEWRPDFEKHQLKNKNGETYWDRSANKYKLKFGLSVTDIGSINFNDNTTRTYNIDNTINEDRFESVDDFDDKLEEFYTLTSEAFTSKTILPTALHFNTDWNINQFFYLNLNTDFAITSKDKENANRITNVYSLTPRFERKWFTFQIPLSIVQYSGFQAGLGFRAGPLYIGSGSVLTLLTTDNSQAADLYAGLKVPVYQSKLKDKDGDGVMDKVDDCPNEAGPEENFGCPWPDTDQDTVLDKDDNCPGVSGPVENKGCPWPDTDGDTILDKDDSCPEVSGPVENKGCPWPDTDGDSVLDKDDACPDVAGTVANKGCPEVKEVTEEVQKTLNAYAKTILFNSGKASIKEESYNVLGDIVTILNEYPDAKFDVEGHTDSAGSNTSNQRLSEERANEVKVYLINKGIDPAKLFAKGYGEDRPIASNATRAGRAQNRRVEINLVK